MLEKLVGPGQLLVLPKEETDYLAILWVLDIIGVGVGAGAVIQQLVVMAAWAVEVEVL